MMWTAEQAVEELRRRGELWQPADGLVALRGNALELHLALDAAFRKLARSAGADEWLTPPVLSLATLARAWHFASLPHRLTAVSQPSDDEGEPERAVTAADSAAARTAAVRPMNVALQPALYYHVYEALADRRLTAAASVTCSGTCWRHEAPGPAPLERGWSVTAREVVRIGSAADVAAFLAQHRAAVVLFARRLGLDPEIEAGENPLLATTPRGETLLQRPRGLEDELLLPLGETRTAAASFHDHDTFFGAAFDIRTATGQCAASGSVTFFIERWLLGVLAAHGPDSAGWPDALAAAERAVRPLPALAAST